jgi:Flp pilus assembly protein TadG
MRSLDRLFDRFFRDRRGNISMIFGLTLVPLVVAVGMGVDYSLATRMKAKLQSAADAAAVASISDNSPGYLAAAQMTSDGTVAAGQTDADNVFNGVMANITGYSGLSESSTVTKTGANLKSTVTFSAQVPTTFLKIAGFTTIGISGTSSAGGSLPPYLDFYLMLDVSGSMGLPSTPGEQARLGAINPDDYVDYVSGSPPTGCTLACHFTARNNGCNNPTIPAQKLQSQSGYPVNNYCLGYIISRVSQSGYASLLTTNNNYPKKQQLPPAIVSGLPNSLYAARIPAAPPGAVVNLTGGGLTAVSNCPTAGTDDCIQLRLDAVGYALNQLFQEANNDEKVTDQFRIGLYPFITDVMTYFGQTTSINGSATTPGTINYAAANLAQLLDTNTNSTLGSGGSHIDNALTEINNIITSVGTGTSANNRQPYVFLVTDGAIDPQMKAIAGGWSGSNHATTLDKQGSLSTVSQCETLKKRNIVVSILYIPYQTISPVVPAFANDEDDYANWNIPYISNSLQKCASPGFFYTANTPQDINDAMVKMFKHALQVAHITK